MEKLKARYILQSRNFCEPSKRKPYLSLIDKAICIFRITQKFRQALWHTQELNSEIVTEFFYELQVSRHCRQENGKKTVKALAHALLVLGDIHQIGSIIKTECVSIVSAYDGKPEQQQEGLKRSQESMIKSGNSH